MLAIWNAFMFGKNSRALRLGKWFACIIMEPYNWVPCLIKGKQACLLPLSSFAAQFRSLFNITALCLTYDAGFGAK